MGETRSRFPDPSGEARSSLPGSEWRNKSPTETTVSNVSQAQPKSEHKKAGEKAGPQSVDRVQNHDHQAIPSTAREPTGPGKRAWDSTNAAKGKVLPATVVELPSSDPHGPPHFFRICRKFGNNSFTCPSYCLANSASCAAGAVINPNLRALQLSYANDFPPARPSPLVHQGIVVSSEALAPGRGSEPAPP